MAIYCTYFDEGYLTRGELMIRSLLKVEPDAEVWILALTEAAERGIRRSFGERVAVVPLADFEASRPDIVGAGAGRSRMEYVFTCTPGWISHVMESSAPADAWVTYLDADLYFFASPAPVYDLMEEGSIGVIPHRFPRWRSGLSRFGTFNVGWVSFRADAEGRRCLSWWDESCVGWCFDRVEGDRFADQGYLDAFPVMSQRTVVLDNAGLNLAPWNLGRHRISVVDGRLLADGETVVFFHFHGISSDGDRYYLKNWYYGARASSVVKSEIYRPYLQALRECVAVEVPEGPTPATVERRTTISQSVRRLVARIAGDTIRLPGE